eukprot:TRINITY_DN596_c0_g1_i1.p1 TRINITY_DN596_c0_g1~~TRINITY_DN596_c0_g1_i1.p1  ORF type:complete len:1490 (-),score=192.16 TRINITY_DN596_c0_g1_i1:4417-8886(-)
MTTASLSLITDLGSSCNKLKVHKKVPSPEEKMNDTIKRTGSFIKASVPELLSRFCDVAKGDSSSPFVSTSILNKFKDLEPKVTPLEQKDFPEGGFAGTYDVTLHSKKLRLKVLKTAPQDIDRIDAIFCEYYLSRSLSAITGSVNRALDLKVTEEGPYVRLELLIELDRTTLKDVMETLVPGESIWIAYKIVDAVSLLGDVMMGQIGLTPDVIDISEDKLNLRLHPTMLVPLFEGSKVNNEILLRSLFHSNLHKTPYTPPEFSQRYEPTSEILVERAEVFTICTILCELLQRETGLPLTENLQQSNLEFINGPLQKSSTKAFADFLENCLHIDPRKRPTLHQLKKALYKEVLKRRPDYMKTQNQFKYFDYKIMGETFESLGKHYLAIPYFREIYRSAHHSIRRSQQVYNLTIASACSKLASINYKLLRIKKAIKYGSVAAKAYDQIYGEFHEKPAEMNYNMGLVYMALSKYRLALRHFHKSLHIFQNIRGEFNESVFNCYTNIGYIYGCLCCYKPAIECFHKSASIASKIFPESSPKSALVDYCSGMASMVLPDYLTALEHFRKAKRLIKKTYGKTHQDLGVFYNNMGMAHQYMGSEKQDMAGIEKSLKYLHKAEKIKAAWLEEPHASLFGVFHNLGLTYVYCSDLEKSGEYFVRAINSGEALEKGRIGELVKSYYLLWNVQVNKQKAEAAEEILAKLFYSTKKSYRKQKLRILALYQIAQNFYSQQHDKENQELYKEKLNNKYERILKKDIHSNILDSLRICKTYIELKLFNEAMQTAKQAEKLLACKHPKKDHDAFKIYLAIGQIQEKLGKHEEACFTYEKAQKSLKQFTYGEEDIVEVYRGIGRTRYKLRNYIQGLVALHKAEEISCKFAEEDSPQVAKIHHELGLAYKGLKDYGSAIRCMEFVEAIWRSLYGVQSVATCKLYADMIEVYKETGDYQKAVKCADLAMSACKNIQDNELLGKIYQNLGNTYKAMNRPKLTIEMLQRALSNKVKSHQENSVEAAKIINSLGEVYTDIEEFKKAADAHLKAAEIFKQTNQQELVDTYLLLSNVYIYKKDIDKGLEYCQTAEDLLATIYGEEHNELVEIYCKIAKIHQQAKNHEIGLSMYCSMASELKEKLGGKGHPGLIRINKIAADICDEMGRPDLAIKYYLESEAIVESKIKSKRNRYSLWEIKETLGKLYAKTEDYKTSLPKYEATEKLLKDQFGETYSVLCRIYYQLSAVCRKLGNNSKAAEYDEKLLELIQSEPRKDQPNMAPEYLNFLNDTEENGEKLYQAIVKGKGRENLEDNPCMGDIYVKYADNCKENVKERENTLKNALKVYVEIYGKNHKKAVSVDCALKNLTGIGEHQKRKAQLLTAIYQERSEQSINVIHYLGLSRFTYCTTLPFFFLGFLDCSLLLSSLATGAAFSSFGVALAGGKAIAFIFFFKVLPAVLITIFDSSAGQCFIHFTSQSSVLVYDSVATFLPVKSMKVMALSILILGFNTAVITN